MITVVLTLVASLLAQDLPCDDPAVACRSVSPFTLSVGGERTDSIDVGKQPWIDPEGRLVIFPGESVTVTTGENGVLALAAIDRAEDIVSDERLVDLLAQAEPMMDPERETVGVLTGKPASDPPSGKVRITFRQALDSENMLLLVENGTDEPLAYNAGMLVAGSTGMVWQATTICVVPRAGRSVEHWQQAIMSLSLGGFERGPEPPANGSICG